MRVTIYMVTLFLSIDKFYTNEVSLIYEKHTVTFMKLSIAICTHNERDYIDTLLGDLCSRIKNQTESDDVQYEIIIVDDYSTDTQVKSDIAMWKNAYSEFVFVYEHALNNDFSTHKNFMNSVCTGNFILNIDADEKIQEELWNIIPCILKENPNIEAFWLPRINIVSGLTLQHVQKWRWVIEKLDDYITASSDISTDEYELLKAYNCILSEQGGVIRYHLPVIQFPDPQMRLYKNDPNIRWENKVHERLVGFKTFSLFPYEKEYAIRHYKDIKRQEAQNSYYETIQR